MSTLRAYAELSRLSNLPTVLSNVLVGMGLGVAASNVAIPWMTAALVGLAISLFYIAGMAMNDLADLDIDRRERPGRPLPSGRISKSGALRYIGACFAIGTILLAIASPTSLYIGVPLVVAIVLYDLLHKKISTSVLLMGICRGLVYLTAAAAVTWPIDLEAAVPLAAALTIYVVLITVIARGEAENRRGMSPRLSMLMIVIAIAPALLIFPSDPRPMIIAAIAMIGWLVFNQRNLLTHPPRIKAAVMGWLAGICLLDAFYLTLLDQPALAVAASICFVVTMLGHRVIVGT